MTRGRLRSSARSHICAVPTSMPAAPDTTMMAASATRMPEITSPRKSA